MFSVLRTILAPQVEAVPEAGILSSEQLLASSDAASNECLSISVSLSEPQSQDQTLETKGVLQRSSRVVALENQPVISDTTLGVLDSKSLKLVTESSPVVVDVGNENTQPIPMHASSGDDLHRTEPVTSFSQQSIKAVQAPSSPRLDQLCKSVANRSDFQEYEEGQAVLRIQAGKIEPLGIPVPSTYADATNLASQYPELAERILALPLTPIKMPRGGPKTEERARLPTSKPKDRGPSHSDATPNWALAPDGVTDEKDEDDGRRRPASRPDRGKGIDRGGIRKTGRHPRSSEGYMTNLSSPTIQKDDAKRRRSEAFGTRPPNIQNRGIAAPERTGRPCTPNSEPSALATKLNLSRASTPCGEVGPRQNPTVADVNSLIQELNSARISHRDSLNASRSTSNDSTATKTSTMVPEKAPMGGPQQGSSPFRSSSKVSAADCDTWSSFILGIQANEGKSSDGRAQQSIQRTPGVPSAPLSAGLNVTSPGFFPAGMRPPVDSLITEDRNAWIPVLDSNTPTRPRSQTPEWRRPDSVSRDPTSKTQAVGKWTSRSRMGSPLSSAKTGRPPFSASSNMPGSRNLDNSRTHIHEPGTGDISGGERRWPTLEEICAVNGSSS